MPDRFWQGNPTFFVQRPQIRARQQHFRFAPYHPTMPQRYPLSDIRQRPFPRFAKSPKKAGGFALPYQASSPAHRFRASPRRQFRRLDTPPGRFTAYEIKSAENMIQSDRNLWHGIQHLTLSKNQTPIEDLDFQLPKELIAQDPLRNREDARLLVVDRSTQTIRHSHVRDLADWLVTGDCLVLNYSKVLMAKLVGYRTQTGGRWQGLFLENSGSGIWRVMCKTRGNIQPGELITLQDRQGADRYQLVMLARLENGCWAVRPEPAIDPVQLMSQLGRVPLPHYIRDGNMKDADVANYQTVYAADPGSVAAPTAGLHFTENLIVQLQHKGVSICPVVLHVGPGTFRPISTQTVEQHEMHAEFGRIDQSSSELINQTRRRQGRVVAVGSTTVRLLESAVTDDGVPPWSGPTELYIHGGHRFKAVDVMMTNFHLPRTTLLAMVRAFGGDSLIRTAYQEALEQRYRFFSYGDAMLIL